MLLLTVALVASYPSYRDGAAEDENNDLELEVRSILNHLNEERSFTEGKENISLNIYSIVLLDADDADDEDQEYEVSKRQGGHNVVDKQSKCEIECIFKQRNPNSGKGKTVKEAAKVCKTLCPLANKKRGQKKPAGKPKREFIEDESESSEEQQQFQRRELYNYLMEQLQENNE